MSEEKSAHLRGEVKILPLDSVEPNSWNPNVVPDHIKASIRQGFVSDGWLVSQALLIWGTDETGAKRNLIIDGEHRWQAAVDVGLKTGPMVVLDKLTEHDAKALTIKLNQKRGDWNIDALTHLLSELTDFDDVSVAALDFGFAESEMVALSELVSPPSLVTTPATPSAQSPLTPTGPRELSESVIRDDVGTKKLRIIIECASRDHAVVVADHCRAEGWAFQEDFA